MNIDLRAELVGILENQWRSKPGLQERFPNIDDYITSMEDLFAIYGEAKAAWNDAAVRDEYFDDFFIYLEVKAYLLR